MEIIIIAVAAFLGYRYWKTHSPHAHPRVQVAHDSARQFIENSRPVVSEARQQFQHNFDEVRATYEQKVKQARLADYKAMQAQIELEVAQLEAETRGLPAPNPADKVA